MVKSNTDKLLAALKRHVPSKVRVMCGEESKDVAVPNIKKKWARVVAAIEARPWSQCELLDKSGAVLAYVENDAAPGELEDLGGSPRAEERIAALMLRVMKEAWSFRNEETSQALQAMSAVVREQTAAMGNLAKLYQAQVVAAQDLATTEAEAANQGQLRELLEAAPQILQVLPHLGKFLNGASKE